MTEHLTPLGQHVYDRAPPSRLVSVCMNAVNSQCSDSLLL